MKITRKIPTIAAITLAAVTCPHLLQAQGGKADERQRSLGRAIEQQLASMNGRQMYVVTDKPLYHPGETVWFRAWAVSIKNLQGVAGEHGITFQLIDPKGAKVAEKRVLSRGGMAANDFEIGAGLAGGAYVLRAISDLGGTEERTVVVSAYEAPRIKKSLDFTRKSYSPSDEVVAHVKIEQPTCGPLVGARVSAVVTLDGAEIALTVREYTLLEYLMRRAGEVVSKTELLDHVWDASIETAPNAVEVYVGYLRRKLGRDILETVRGAGYRLTRE